MKWGFRWYGAAGDAIPLKHIRQIPGITGVVGTLLNKLPGDVWTVAEIQALKQSVEQEGLALLGIESVAIHDAIKAERINETTILIIIAKRCVTWGNVEFP